MTLIRRRRPRPVPPLPAVDTKLGLSVEQQIYRSLRNALMAGRVLSGQGLTIRSIAQMLGVRPAPVREALRRLVADGVLIARPNSAFYTPHLDSEQFKNILQVRLQLEGYAAREAAIRAIRKDIRLVEMATLRWERAVERRPGDVAPANHAFHFAIYQACKNPVLIGLIETLWVRMGPVLASLPPECDFGVALNAHDAALKAMQCGDGDAAERAIRSDLSVGGAAIHVALVKLENSRIYSAA